MLTIKPMNQVDDVESSGSTHTMSDTQNATRSRSTAKQPNKKQQKHNKGKTPSHSTPIRPIPQRPSVSVGGKLTFPNVVVTDIRANEFANNHTLKEINIPDSIETIGVSSFSNCTKVTSIHLGTGLKEVSDNAFKGLTKVRDLVIPNSVTRIGKDALSGMKLKSLFFYTPENCNVEGSDYTVEYTNKESKLRYPRCFTREMRDKAVSAFQHEGLLDKDEMLTQKAIDDARSIMSFEELDNENAKRDMTDIDINGRWRKCTTKSIKVDFCNNPIEIHFYMNMMTKKTYLKYDYKIKVNDYKPSSQVAAGKPNFAQKTMRDETKSHSPTTELTKLELPKDINTIREHSYKAISEELVIIPYSVTSIGYGSFVNCKNLKAVTIYKADIGPGVFFNCPNLNYIYIRDGVESIGNNSFSLNYDEIGGPGNYGPNSIYLPDSLVNIGNGCFQNLNAVNYVNLGNNLTSIGNGFMAGNNHCRFTVRDGAGKENVKKLLINAGIPAHRINK